MSRLISNFYLNALTKVTDPYILYKYDRLKEATSLVVDDSLEGNFDFTSGKLLGICRGCFGPFKWELGNFTAEITPENENYYALLSSSLLKGKVFKNFGVLAKEFTFNVKTLNKNQLFENQKLLLITDYLKDKKISEKDGLLALKDDLEFQAKIAGIVKPESREKITQKYKLLFAK